MMPLNETVWLITGCSTGFGREIALCALQHGARVAVTARRVEAIADIREQYPEHALALPLDINDAGQREAALQSTLEHFGQLAAAARDGDKDVGRFEIPVNDAVCVHFAQTTQRLHGKRPRTDRTDIVSGNNARDQSLVEAMPNRRLL